MGKKHRTIMWALPWKYRGKEHPAINEEGAWMLCYTEEMARRRQIDPKQEPRKVKVTIEEEADVTQETDTATT